MEQNVFHEKKRNEFGNDSSYLEQYSQQNERAEMLIIWKRIFFDCALFFGFFFRNNKSLLITPIYPSILRQSLYRTIIRQCTIRNLSKSNDRILPSGVMFFD